MSSRASGVVGLDAVPYLVAPADDGMSGLSRFGEEAKRSINIRRRVAEA